MTATDHRASSDLAEFSPATAAAIARARQHSLGDLLNRTARRHPDKLAVVAHDRRATFAEFDAAVDRCAGSLAARGMSKGDRLALLSRNSWEFAVLAFATARLGVILVPINFMLNPTEIGFILDHSGATALVAEAALAPTAEQAITLADLNGHIPIRGRVASEDMPVPADWENVGSWIDPVDGAADLADLEITIEDDDPLRLMYTSGTESRPKGVLLSAKSLISQYVSCIVDGGMVSDDIEIHALPMFHCAQLDAFFAVDVYLGATSVILPNPEPSRLLATIEQERVTKLFCPPTVWISLLQHPDFHTRDLSSLRKGYYGASPMPVEVLRELAGRLPDVQFWNFYGQTEMSPVATILGPHEQEAFAGGAGRAALNVEVRVVDEDDNPVAPGDVGEIVHRSPHAAIGYYNDEHKTAEAFRHGWFHSGDLGVMDENGYLTVVDRKKDMIKTGGENVASREVEEVLYQLHGVAEVAVVGISHPRWIEAVTAIVVPRPGVNLTRDAVHTHARDKLAGYKRPKYVVFADSLPKNPSGKILKKELRAEYADLANSL